MLIFGALIGSILVSGAIGGAGQAGQAAPTVTLDLPPSSIVAALHELSPLVGQNLTTVPSLANEVVFISVKDVPAKEVLERFAKMMGATWQAESSGMRLMRTSKNVADLRAKEQAVLAGRFRQKQDTFRKELSKRASWNPQSAFETASALTDPRPPTARGKDAISYYNRMRTIQDQLPGRAALKLMVLAFKPEELTTLGPGERVVFSSQPNQLQRPMSRAMLDVVDRYVREMKLWTDAAAKVQPGTASSSDDPRSRRNYELGGLLEGTPQKAMFVLSRDESDEFSASLSLRDASGASVAEESDSILGGMFDQITDRQMLESMDSMANGAASPPKVDEPELHDASPIEFSEPSKSFMRMFMSSSEVSDNFELPKIEPVLRDALRDPIAFDPIRIVVGDVVSHLQKLEKKNVMAWLPDDVLSTMFMGARNVPTVAGVRKLWDETGLMDVVSEPAWVTLRPAMPVRCERLRMNRPALKRFLATVERKRFVPLNEFAKFGSQNPDNPMSDLSGLYLFAFCPEILSAASSDKTALQFYLSLSDLQLNTLTTKGSMPVSGLTMAQMSMLNRLVYGYEERLEPFTEESAIPPGTAPRSDTVNEESDGPPMLDPTDALPFGLPRNGIVEMTFSFDDVVRPDKGGAFGMFGSFLDPEELGGIIEESKVADPGQEMGMDYRISEKDKFRVGVKTSISFRIRWSKAYCTTMDIEYDDFDRGAATLGLSDLPAKIKAKVEEGRKAAREEIAQREKEQSVPPPVVNRRPPPPIP